MKRIFRILTIAIFVLALPILIHAQGLLRHPNNGNRPGTYNHPVGWTNPSGIPIDGGLSIMLLLAFGYGAKKVRGLKTQNKE